MTATIIELVVLVGLTGLLTYGVVAHRKDRDTITEWTRWVRDHPRLAKFRTPIIMGICGLLSWALLHLTTDLV